MTCGQAVGTCECHAVHQLHTLPGQSPCPCSSGPMCSSSRTQALEVSHPWVWGLCLLCYHSGWQAPGKQQVLRLLKWSMRAYGLNFPQVSVSFPFESLQIKSIARYETHRTTVCNGLLFVWQLPFHLTLLSFAMWVLAWWGARGAPGLFLVAWGLWCDSKNKQAKPPVHCLRQYQGIYPSVFWF